MYKRNKMMNKIYLYHYDIEKVVKCQAIIRGFLYRNKILPNILYTIQRFLMNQSITFCQKSTDGRVNSCLDEIEIIKLLQTKFNNRIKTPSFRMWYDILVFDYRYGWLPVNIKSTKTTTADNTGNLTMCVYAYTNEHLDLDKRADNGAMSQILFQKLKDRELNNNPKKDYYFIVLNKTNTQDIIVNSVKGLTHLTPNINNLPFQICWNKNRDFQYDHISKKVELFITTLKKQNPSWKETFMSNIRTL